MARPVTMARSHTVRWAWLAVLWLFVAGCASTRPRHAEGLSGDSALGADKTVLLMPIDIELAELLASGMMEPRGQWTETARALIADEVRRTLDARGARLRELDRETLGEDADRVRQLELLYEVVGSQMLGQLHAPLPTKKDFDWTLGPGTRVLARHSGADYALFTLVRDSYASEGRKAVMVVGALIGVSVSLGQQVGFTALVELETGRIVWSNFLVSGSGDLRNEKGASAAVAHLLKGLPL